ncbi:pyruvate,water dikinase [Kibdelosporangium banguiense]|uniref:Pyruvate,water dikinase n=1 Tax=Kibdelosporangium banguiense TaxID=1365924 RepID=A0ABS4T771_9PSEU|nr:PEP/pyruvate-binding domain-containing protein [Kibdelosporangium banguiense]MBP2320265.1 pyruvate,water dikinase [Kibdelosporangium banguiense]
MTTWTRDFEAIDAGMLATVGGKAANLGELTRAGLPVPSGFCVTTEAYRQVATLAGVDGSHEAEKARELILGAPVPAEISAAILAGYAGLGDDVPVAVRSSATAEDLPFASFAGQQDTYLNVVGGEAVLDAVRRCWASLWTDRAFSYRATNEIDNSSVQLAVVIQRMVQSDVAGVMFTANPVTGRRHEYVIDASPGLGEAVVSGAVNPDHFVVQDKKIVERRLGDKRLTIRSLPGGGTEHVELTVGSDEPCVTDEQVLALASLGAKVEQHYGSPQDTEWAIDGDGELWLTQSRPITTLYPLPEKSGKDTRAYFSFSVAQGLYRPITPAGMAVFRLIASSAGREIFGIDVADPLAGPPAFAEAGGRVYLDATNVVRSKAGRQLMPKVLGVMEARSGKVLTDLFDDPRFSLTQKSRRKFVLRLLRLAVKYRIPPRMLQALISPAAAHRNADKVGEQLRRRIALPGDATAIQRLDHIERVLLKEIVPLLPRVIPSAGAGFAMLGLAGKLLGGTAGLQPVLRGLPHNITTEMDLELWHLATRIRGTEAAALFRDLSAEELAQRYREGTLPDIGLAEFLRHWGHRAVAEIDVGMPRWSDDPTHILGVLANYLRLDNPEMAPDAQFARGAAEAAETIDRLVAGTRRKRTVRFALNRARELAGLREMPKYFLIVALGAVRGHLAHIGAELAGAGRIASAEDVFFLNLKEMRAALAGITYQDVVATRRADYDQELRRRRIPRVMLSDGTEPEAVSQTAPAADGSLPGTPASAGTITGIARVVLDPVGAHLEPGEILVAPSTDPGWTPLFLTAGGLVMEMGGANSHGAVVAREYGIPAVVGVADATHRITTGQTITVDGATGVVTPA